MTDIERLSFADKSVPKDAKIGSIEEQKSSESEAIDLDEEIENKIINALICYKTKEEQKDIKFYLISSNIQLKTIKDEYKPLEIGLVEYTIRNGINTTYHQLIDCGDIPLGYAFTAIDHMERTHKIPLKNFVLASNDYQKIWTQILEFLSDSYIDEMENEMFGRPMIVFSQSDQIQQNYGALKWLQNNYNKEDNDLKASDPSFKTQFNIKVLNVSKLLSVLFSTSDIQKTEEWCEKAITSPAFDWTPGTDCPFHEDIQCIDCALGVAKRMTYLLSHFLRQPYDIRLTPNHLPTLEDNSTLNKAIDKFENMRIREEDNEYKPNQQFVLDDVQVSQEVNTGTEVNDWGSNEKQESDDDIQEVKVIRSNRLSKYCLKPSAGRSKHSDK